MTIKVKPQGLKYKMFQIYTKVIKITKPQRPKWQFTLHTITLNTIKKQVKYVYMCCNISFGSFSKKK
ncbi:hypothetical protein Hanom_Chr07g00656391 [Helianthus anomalus]